MLTALTILSSLSKLTVLTILSSLSKLTVQIPPSTRAKPLWLSPLVEIVTPILST